MTDEERARIKAATYKTVYDEDFILDDEISKPKINNLVVKKTYQSLKQKHYYDGYLQGVKDAKAKPTHIKKKSKSIIEKIRGLVAEIQEMYRAAVGLD